ncbi:hypothetical protein D3C71_1458140 [compost metagenome]
MLHGAVGIAQRCRLQRQIPVAGDGAALAVVQRALHLDRIGLLAGRHHGAAAIIKAGCIDGELGSVERGVAVIHRAGGQRQRTGGGDGAALAIQLSGGKRQALITGMADRAVFVDQTAGFQRQ